VVLEVEEEVGQVNSHSKDMEDKVTNLMHRTEAERIHPHNYKLENL